MNDILNFITKDSSISMTMEMYEAMIYRAKADERKIIATLLEEHEETIYGCRCGFSNAASAYSLHAIALIKGENK